MVESRSAPEGKDPVRIATIVVGVLLALVVASIAAFVLLGGDDAEQSGEPQSSGTPTTRTSGTAPRATSSPSSTTTSTSTTSSTSSTTTSTTAPPTTAPPSVPADPDAASKAAAVRTVDAALAQCGWSGQGTVVIQAEDFQLWLVQTTVDHDGFRDVVQFRVDTATELPVAVATDQLGAELIGCIP